MAAPGRRAAQTTLAAFRPAHARDEPAALGSTQPASGRSDLPSEEAADSEHRVNQRLKWRFLAGPSVTRSRTRVSTEPTKDRPLPRRWELHVARRVSSRSGVGPDLLPGSASAARGRCDCERGACGEEGAGKEHSDADPEDRVQLGTDAQLGGDAAGPVLVHHDRPPVPSYGSHSSARSPAPAVDATQNVSSPGRPVGSPPERREYSGSPSLSRSSTTSRPTPPRYRVTSPAGPIPTNTGRSLSLRIRTVPRNVSSARSAPSSPRSTSSDTIAYVRVEKSCVGDMRNPSSSRCVWSTATSAQPPTRSPSASRPAMVPTTTSAIRPPVQPRRTGGSVGEAGSRAAAGSANPSPSVPCWLSRNVGYSSRMSSTYATTRATQRSSPAARSKSPPGYRVSSSASMRTGYGCGPSTLFCSALARP